MRPSLIIAAAASGSGKTLITLALLRHFRNQGRRVGSFKVGPDYIDPAFHAAATGRACINLDGWAMRPEMLTVAYAAAADDVEFVIGEGVMGLFDGALNGSASTADLAVRLGVPIVLVVDVTGQAASAAAVVHGFDSYRDTVGLAGVVFNRVGSPLHAQILRDACRDIDVPVLGFLPRNADFTMPKRYLGLVQAGERADLDDFLERAAAFVAEHVDTRRLYGLAERGAMFHPAASPPPIDPLGQRIAVADDIAFSFAYRLTLEGWRRAGAEVLPFSPLADEAPAADADAVYLPGGYPEFHAGRIAANQAFLRGLRDAAAAGRPVFGECGGYMVLGEGIVDAEGGRHAMAGLLPLETSFSDARLHLGYRAATLLADGPLGPAGTVIRGHEFHYANVVREDGDRPLFRCEDALGTDRGAIGAVRGSVAGSFLHLIDRASVTNP